MATEVQILRGTPATLEVQHLVDGVGTDFDGGNPTIGIVNQAGDEVVAPLTPITNAAGSGVYQYQLTAQADLAVLTITWSGTHNSEAVDLVTYAEVVGAYLFSIADARSAPNTKLSDESKYPAATIADLRADVSDWFEQICNVSFVPRRRRITLEGSGTNTLLLPVRRLISVAAASVDGTALTAAELAEVRTLRRGTIRRMDGQIWPKESLVVVEADHGFEAVPPQIRSAALEYLADRIRPGRGDSRTLSFTDESGTQRFAVAGKHFPTGIPDVDVVLYRYTEPAV